MRVLAVSDDSLPVGSVLLEIAEQPPDTLLVVLVLLAFDDDLNSQCLSMRDNEMVLVCTDLLAAVDELVSPLLREVLFGEELLGAIRLLVSTVLVLLRDTICELILEKYRRRQQGIRSQRRIYSREDPSTSPSNPASSPQHLVGSPG